MNVEAVLIGVERGWSESDALRIVVTSRLLSKGSTPC